MPSLADSARLVGNVMVRSMLLEHKAAKPQEYGEMVAVDCDQ